jgi:hypothetical protein
MDRTVLLKQLANELGLTCGDVKVMTQESDYKRNWFYSLNDALVSENLMHTWSISHGGLAYGETKRYYHEEVDGDLKSTRVIILYRDENGRYERPIHYKTY